MALVLALYLLLCVRVTADVCAGAAKGQIVFSADVGALMFHAQVNGHIHGRKLSMRFPLPALKKKPGANGRANSKSLSHDFSGRRAGCSGRPGSIIDSGGSKRLRKIGPDVQRCPSFKVRHVRTTGMSSHRVVYCGVRRSCFIAQRLRSPSKPVLPSNTVPRP